MAVELPVYNEIVHTRKRILDRDPRHQVELFRRHLRDGTISSWAPLVPPELSDEERLKGTNWNSCFENFILILIILNSFVLAFDSPL